ncbi:DUF6911 family protein [Pseudomonas poae]|uniref:DUF6911 family protein n=1 Tax=Pseudomonas poae TaxID=200451 RepID=UPI003CC6AA6C
MKSIISKYREVDGVASLSISPALEYGPYEINLYADSGNYLLMLNQYLKMGSISCVLLIIRRGGKFS